MKVGAYFADHWNIALHQYFDAIHAVGEVRPHLHWGEFRIAIVAVRSPPRRLQTKTHFEDP